MLVDFPLPYRDYCTPFRKRFPGSVELLDFVTLDVAEIAADDAPKAARLTDGSGGETLRWHGGGYWMPDVGGGRASGRLRTRLGFGSERIETELGSESLFLHLHFPHVLDRFRRRSGRTVESERCRAVTGDTREEALTALGKRVGEKLLSIGGVLHMSVAEPFRILHVSDDGVVSTASLGMPPLEVSRRSSLASPASACAM